MSPPSLQQLAQRACIKNIRSLITVGHMPYDLVRSILLRVENPDQLREIEESSPHICRRDAELWKEFVRRDIPNGLSKISDLGDSTDWYNVYMELLAISQDEAEADARTLEAAMKDLADERSKNTAKFVNARSLPKLPGKGVRRQNTASAAVSGNPAVLSFAAGSKTKTLTGRDVLNRVRKEAREASLFSARKSALAVPTHRLADKASQPRTAPAGLVQGHRKAPVHVNDATIKIRVPGRQIDGAESSSIPSPTAGKHERRSKVLPIGEAATPKLEERRASKPFKKPDDASLEGASSKMKKKSAVVLQQTPSSKISASPERTLSGHNASPLGGRPKPVMRKAPVDIFMPLKKRRVG